MAVFPPPMTATASPSTPTSPPDFAMRMKSSASHTPAASSPSIPSRGTLPIPTAITTASYSARIASAAIVSPTAAPVRISTPSARTCSASHSAISAGSRNGTMPYVSSPPGASSRSKITTACPMRARSRAAASPAGPEPMTATRLPVGGPASNSVAFSRIAQSVA